MNIALAFKPKQCSISRFHLNDFLRTKSKWLANKRTSSTANHHLEKNKTPSSNIQKPHTSDQIEEIFTKVSESQYYDAKEKTFNTIAVGILERRPKK